MRATRLQISGFLVLGILFLAGCGSQKTQTGSPASGTTDLASTASNFATAKCSQDVSNVLNLAMKLKVFEDSMNGLRTDWIRVRFERFPSEFSNDNSSALQLWSRTIDSSGNWGAWYKVPFKIEYYTTMSVSVTSVSYTDLTWAQMIQIADSFGIARANAQQAIASMVLRAELPDTSASKILTVKLYMSGSSPEVTSLLPPFKANPREYAKDRPVALQNLHPLLSLTNANLSESQYQTSANQFCF